MRNFKISAQFLALLAGLLFFAGCQQDETVSPLDNVSIDMRGFSATGILPGSVFYGISAVNELVVFTSGPPATEISSFPLKGLASGDTMLAIDFRPKTKQLYGVSSNSLIYLIDRNTGFAAPVSQIAFNPPINGNMVGFDFNPMDDRIRLVTDNDQNLRISPTSGQVVGVDKSINPESCSINSIAYSLSPTVGLTSGGVTLNDIDMATGNLYRQNHNFGTLTFVGSLGVTVLSEGGFDAQKSIGWAVFNGSSLTGGFGPGINGPDDLNEEAYRLWRIDLRTGKASSFGQVRAMIGLAVPQ